MVNFTKTYCISFKEAVDANDDVPTQKRIVISAKTITIGDMDFENNWGE